MNTDLSFLETGRDAESRAVFGGTPDLQPNLGVFESDFEGLEPDGDILALDTLRRDLPRHVDFCERAFSDRGLDYPFDLSPGMDGLRPRVGREELAKKVVALANLANIGQKQAAEFERRAAAALQRLVGGTLVAVGAPRSGKTGPERAVEQFREIFRAESGKNHRKPYPHNGDLGADALGVLGRAWGGPIVFLQVKNASYDQTNPPSEFLRVGDVILDWFGRPLHQHRATLQVLAVNDVLTLEKKEELWAGRTPGSGFHLLDRVDILLAETWMAADAHRPDGMPDGEAAFHSL